MERTSQVSQAGLELCTQQRMTPGLSAFTSQSNCWDYRCESPSQLEQLQAGLEGPILLLLFLVGLDYKVMNLTMTFLFLLLPCPHSTPHVLFLSLSLLPLLPQVLLCYHTYRLPSLCQSYLCPSRPKSAVFDTQPYASTSSVACEFSPSP